MTDSQIKQYFEQDDMGISQTGTIDLHLHSFYSDGDYSPDQLVQMAYQKGIRVMAITDHNTIAGNQKIDWSQEIHKEITVIPGIELSAKSDTGKIHILGYGIDLANKELQEKMKELQTESLYSVLTILTEVQKQFGISFTQAEVAEMIGVPHDLGRPDIARLLVQNGYVSSVREAFDRYLTAAYETVRHNIKRLSCQECIELIQKAGGIPVLAHPTSTKQTGIAFLQLLRKMINWGLKGMEVFHSDLSPEKSKELFQIAEQEGLLFSGGSDYHGPLTKPDIEIGDGRNHNLRIRELSILDHLKR